VSDVNEGIHRVRLSLQYRRVPGFPTSQ
jgi:hypothetical protein